MYAPLQGRTAQKILIDQNVELITPLKKGLKTEQGLKKEDVTCLKKEDISSLKYIIFFNKGRILKGALALRLIFKLLYPYLSLPLFILPSGFYGFFYQKIAKNRYSWFGKKADFKPNFDQKKYFLP